MKALILCCGGSPEPLEFCIENFETDFYYFLHSNETINLFSRQEMSKQHFIVYYYGKNKLENLALHRAFLEENQAKSQLIKTMSIDRDIFVDKENLVGEPQFEMKSKEENIEKIKEKIGLLCNKHA